MALSVACARREEARHLARAAAGAPLGDRYMKYIQYIIAVIMLALAVGFWGSAIGIYITRMTGAALPSSPAVGEVANKRHKNLGHRWAIPGLGKSHL